MAAGLPAVATTGTTTNAPIEITKAASFFIATSRRVTFDQPSRPDADLTVFNRAWKSIPRIFKSSCPVPGPPATAEALNWTPRASGPGGSPNGFPFASVTFPAGSSKFEPGAVPATDMTVSWLTFKDAADQAGMSRRYGGIHFEKGDLDGRAAGRLVAQEAWTKARSYFAP